MLNKSVVEKIEQFKSENPTAQVMLTYSRSGQSRQVVLKAETDFSKTKFLVVKSFPYSSPDCYRDSERVSKMVKGLIA